MSKRVISLAFDAHPPAQGLHLQFFQQLPGHDSLKTTGIYPVGIHYHIRQSLINTVLSNGVNIFHSFGGVCSTNMKKHNIKEIRS